MTTIEALREVYKALGGTGTDIADNMTIPEALVVIATAVASTIELPAVTTSNNGQVLTVSAGKWVAADIPSQLPAVSAPDDVGKVLKVNDSGVWAPGTDATE